MLLLSRPARSVMCTAVTPVTFSCHWNTGLLLMVRAREEVAPEYHTDRYTLKHLLCECTRSCLLVANSQCLVAVSITVLSHTAQSSQVHPPLLRSSPSPSLLSIHAHACWSLQFVSFFTSLLQSAQSQ